MRPKRNKVQPDVDGCKWVITRTDVKLNVRYLPPTNQSSTDKTQAIFFIHGVAGCSDIWSAQLRHFSERGYHVIAPDLVGHGFSSAPSKASLYRFRWICHDCITVFDHFYQDVNIVVGHSYGTSFAAYLARMRPSKIDKLVLMSGGAPVALSPQRGVFSLPSPVLSCIRPAMTRIFNKSAFHHKSKDLPNKEAAFDVPLYVLRHTMNGQVWDDGDELFHKLITQPTLLLHGEDDGLESLQGTQEMHDTLLKSEFYQIPDSSHMIMMEQPIVVNRLIDRFLDGEKPNHIVSSAGSHVPLDSDISLPAERPMSPYVSTNGNCSGEIHYPGVESPRSPRQSKPSNSHAAHHLTKSQPNLRKSIKT